MTDPNLASASFDDAGGRGLVVGREGTVCQTEDPVEPWLIEFPEGSVVPVVSRFVRELTARDASSATCRSYAFDLLRWWRYLAARDRPWTHAGRDDVREFVLWLRNSDNPQRRPGRVAVNARTGKPNLAAGYAPATVNHALSVISVFYDFAAEQGEGPVVNPVPVARPGTSWLRRLGLDEEFLLPKRAPYRQRQPDHVPRAVDDGLLLELFDALGSTATGP